MNSAALGLRLRLMSLIFAVSNPTVRAAEPETEALRFIACPAYRDTDSGRKSGCWLADDPASGQRWDLQQSLTKPQLGQEILVEAQRAPPGRRSTADCGGEVLAQPRVSVLPGRCPALVLPAEGYLGKRFELPAAVMTANHLPQPMPTAPYRSRSFDIHFNHADDYLLYQHAEVPLQQAVRLARLGNAQRVRVVGHAATAPETVSGRVLQEPAGLAQARAEMAAEALVRLGWPRAQISLSTGDDPPGSATDSSAPALAQAGPAFTAAAQRRVRLVVEIAPPAAATGPVFGQAAPPPWRPNDAPGGSGPYPALMEMVAGLPHHTVYRPADLAALGALRLPVLAWANGACHNVGNRFRSFLTEIASHGFLVIASGPIHAPEVEGLSGGGGMRGVPAPGSPAALAGAGASNLAHTGPGQLSQAIDWAATVNQRLASPWQGRIDAQQVALMGQSCGGLQAIAAAAADPRVRTLGVWNSGTLDDEVMAERIAGGRVTKALVAQLDLPALYVTGEASDVAFANAAADFERLPGRAPTVWAWREAVGHSGTYREPGGGAFGSVAVAWLRWQLQGDAVAARQFSGADCGLCRQPGWHVRRKGLAD